MARSFDAPRDVGCFGDRSRDARVCDVSGREALGGVRELSANLLDASACDVERRLRRAGVGESHACLYVATAAGVTRAVQMRDGATRSAAQIASATVTPGS